ncbi:MAG TPA: hypothetical protein VFQ54_11920 [Thermomicrobiales bacterium]|nr:hypothetical protein [Thermomicrobiales bacterium]
MTKTIEYTGGENPFADIAGFVGRAKSQYPGISDYDVNVIVKRTLGLRMERHKQRVVTLFGADIMTEQLEDIPSWSLLEWRHRSRIASYPLHGGDMADEANFAESQKQLILRLDTEHVNRSVLISPRGLGNTYVWCAGNEWRHEVSDADYDLILATPARRFYFRDPDVHGLFVEQRAYMSNPVLSRHSGTPDEFAAFMDDRTRKPQWQGASLKE